MCLFLAPHTQPKPPPSLSGSCFDGGLLIPVTPPNPLGTNSHQHPSDHNILSLLFHRETTPKIRDAAFTRLLPATPLSETERHGCTFQRSLTSSPCSYPSTTQRRSSSHTMGVRCHAAVPSSSPPHTRHLPPSLSPPGLALSLAYPHHHEPRIYHQSKHTHVSDLPHAREVLSYGSHPCVDDPSLRHRIIGRTFLEPSSPYSSDVAARLPSSLRLSFIIPSHYTHIYTRVYTYDYTLVCTSVYTPPCSRSSTTHSASRHAKTAPS